MTDRSVLLMRWRREKRKKMIEFVAAAVDCCNTCDKTTAAKLVAISRSL
uniref:Uncharacterized protein n=1 Tax=Arundo donax TaxID=35708 RepID=A0A0A9AKZ4_ARUDO